MVWGATFLVVGTAVRFTGPMFFVGLRFATAGLVSALLFRRLLRGLRWTEVGAGAAIGSALFFGYGLQTVGQQTVSASATAFITALYVPLVPLLQWAAFRRRPALMTLVGVTLAFGGLVLLAGPTPDGLALGGGELAVLAGTLATAGEIILISIFAGRVDLGRVTVVQLVVAGALGFIAMPVTGEGFPAFSWVWLTAAIGLGLASCVIQLTMNWAQRSVSPTKATLIYAAEPVWGGVFGRLAGERLAPLALLGAACIVVGALISELKPSWGAKARRRAATEDGPAVTAR